MTILLTGATGKTGLRLARLLQAADKRVLLTYRNTAVPAPFTGVHFDWHDPTTFENPFAADPQIERVYLVAPLGIADVLGPMKPFIDLAVKKGVKRFVFLGVSTLDAGGPNSGAVHEYLISLGVDYFVIRSTWYLENFLREQIKDQGTIVSASADGKIGFVSVDDVAALAFDALTVEKSYNTDKILLGPELLSYDDVAKIFSDVLGRTITHTRISVEDYRKLFISFGIEEEYAGILASLQGLNASGVEEKLFANPNKVTGKKTLRSFIEENKGAWVN